MFGKLEDENLKKEFLAAFYSEDLLFCGSTSGKVLGVNNNVLRIDIMKAYLNLFFIFFRRN